MTTVILLFISNTFMTFAWYGHLKRGDQPLPKAIVLSWLIVLGEYCFQVPANRIGYRHFTGYQLNIIHADGVRGVRLLLLGRTAPMELSGVHAVPVRGGVLSPFGCGHERAPGGPLQFPWRLHP
jgi:Putative member of DMT superfamily (DUF486)